MSKRVDFSALTKAQQFALLDVVSRGGLHRIRPGYDGTVIHTRSTMQALERRGACTLPPGSVEPTKAGRSAVIKRYGSLTKAYLALCEIKT